MEKTAPFIVIVVFALGCADATRQSTDHAPRGADDRAPASAKHDSFLEATDGKGDTLYDIQEGSAKAEALLDFVNSASLSTLDDDVSLDVRAAENIVEARSDGDIATLKELDAIAWVSSRAFGKLYTYCQERGIIGDGGSADPVHGVEPGSDEAETILELANTASQTTLDDDVGLDRRAAENIVAYRHGDDGDAGTADDRTFQTLAELDDVDWVGARAFDKLLSFDGKSTSTDDAVPEDSARAHGAFAVANSASKATLDDDVGLDARAAQNIVDHRGRDEDAGGHVDFRNKIESLKELNGIDWVGDASIRDLADYAEANDALPEVHHGLPVGSRRATGVLKAANTLDESTLADEVGLDSRAAANILDYREGHDGTLGTDDDQTFETVEQLASVSYVADAAFDSLLSKAEAEGWVPAEHWHDVLPEGRIERDLPIVDYSCYDPDDSFDGLEPESDSPHGRPRVLEEGGSYRMYGDKQGRLSVEFSSDVHSDRIPDQEPIDIQDNGRFDVSFTAGGHTWEELEHTGKITRTGRMFVLLSAHINSFEYSDDLTTYCQLELQLPEK